MWVINVPLNLCVSGLSQRLGEWRQNTGGTNLTLPDIYLLTTKYVAVGNVDRKPQHREAKEREGIKCMPILYWPATAGKNIDTCIFVLILIYEIWWDNVFYSIYIWKGLHEWIEDHIIKLNKNKGKKDHLSMVKLV